MKKLLITTLLVSSAALAQRSVSPLIYYGTYASKPAAGLANQIAIITDCADTSCSTGGGSTVRLMRDTGSAWAVLGDGDSGGSPSFASVTAGTNAAALVIGTSGSLTVSGSGTINATSLGGTAAASYALLNSPSFTTPTLGAALATSIAFGADPADGGAIRCSNNTTCIASEIATPGTDMTFGSNASNQWVASHAIVAPGFVSSDASNAGYFEFGQGTATSPSANSVRLYGAATIGTAWAGVLPSAIGSTGFMKVSVSGAIATYSHAALVAGDLPAALSSSTSINGLGITASTGTLTIANGKTASISNTLTFTGTDSSSVAFGAGGTVLYSGGALGTPSSGTATNITGLPVGGMTIAAMSFPCNVTSSSAAGTACGFGVSPLSSKSAAYTTTITDAGALILHPTADNNARTFTIDSNANVAYPLGTCITFYNQINTVTIAITSDTLTLAGAGTTGSRTLAANGIATACKIATTSWVINGTGLT